MFASHTPTSIDLTISLAAADLRRLAHRIAERGIDQVADEVRPVVEAGRRSGIREIADIVADPAAPAVARERAFGKLAWRLTQLEPAPCSTDRDPAQFTTAA